MLSLAKMLSFSILASTVALYSQVTIHAMPIETSAYTPIDNVVCLSRGHPAYGAKLDPKVVTALTPVIPAVSANVSISAAESLEASKYQQQEQSAAAPGKVQPSSSSSPGNTTATLAESPVQSFSGHRHRDLEATSQDLQRLEAHFGVKMERNTAKLVKKADFATIPWPSSYWPVYQDSINAKWDQTQPSAAEKYAKAYNLNVKQFMDKVSQTNGILSQQSRPTCTVNSQCTSLNDGSICGKRTGETNGYCIPGWYGICHAWAPAAILEPEPKCPVTKNGVTFQPFDIKALLTAIYDGANIETVFTGVRFNGPDNAPNNKDKYGRFTDPAERDLGAGYFHLAVTNILGKFKQSFVVDVTAGSEVWNQPVRGYEILESSTMTPAQAAQKYFRTSAYPFNNAAKKIMYVKNRFSWVVEMVQDGALVSSGLAAAKAITYADYTYLLELDGQSNVIGGEWVGASMSEHPDFLWLPFSKPAANAVTALNLSYKNVHELLTASVNGRC
ncbi:hypothetical protein Gpo141_00009702 [Globisporangium polare]